MNDAQIREILAQEMESAGEKTLAVCIRDNVDNSVGGLAALAACRRVRDWAVKECAEKIDGVAESIRAVAE